MELGKNIKGDVPDSTIRWYESPSDDEQIVRLWKAAFKNDINYELWRWKYQFNPFGSRIKVFDDHEKGLLAAYGGIPYTLYCRGETGTATQLMDVMSHPDARGSGLFARTAANYLDELSKESGMKFAYGIPGEYHFYLGEKYLEYSRIENGVSYFEADVKQLFTNSLKEKQLVPLNWNKKTQRLMDRFWTKVKKDYPLAVKRDSLFYKWRFFDHPEKKYEVLGFFTGMTKKIQCIGVFFLESKKNAVLVDMLCPDDVGIVHGFFQRAGQYLSRKNVRQVKSWLPANHFLADSLIEAGFDKKPEPLGIIPTIQIYDDNLDENWVHNHFYYTMADSDLF